MSSMLLAVAAAAVTPGPTVTAEQALENARAVFSAEPRKAAPCPDAKGDEIVVCAEPEDPAGQYVPSATDNGDPDDGMPRAPDVSGLPTDGIRIGKTPRHPLIIDLSKIPEAPAGSDAGLIARGEMAAP
jgi:hypothetical protein